MSRRMRSRATSLPRATCRFFASSLPPCRTAWSLPCRSSTRRLRTSALRTKAGARASIVEGRTVMDASGRSAHSPVRPRESGDPGPSAPALDWAPAFAGANSGRTALLSRTLRTSARLVVELGADQHAADFAGACADLVELGIAQQPSSRIVVGVAIAAEELDRVERHCSRALGREQDRACGILARGLAAVAGLGDRIHIGLTGIHGDVHVGDLATHQLEFADRLAELFALVDVGHHHVHAGLHDAKRTGREHDALKVEARHHDLPALVDAAKHVLLRHLAIREHELAGVGAAHAKLVELLSTREALGAPLDDERGEPAF